MRLWIMSDLHLEATRNWDLPPPPQRPDFDAMIIAGDLITRAERGVKWLRERVKDQPVIYVIGNHESYGTDWNVTIEKARTFAAGSNIHVLQNDTLIIDDVTFVGGTLWTDFTLFGDVRSSMDFVGNAMNDYCKIRKGNYEYRLRPQDTLKANRTTREFIASAVRSKTTGRICAITHHGPAPATVKLGAEIDPISAAYVNGEYTDLMAGIDNWIYGHTHETRDFMIGSTRVVTNAKGYGPWRNNQTWENQNFDPTLTIDI